MAHFSESDIFVGLSGVQLDFDEIELGQGIILRHTYAHLMSPFLMAFAPAPPGKPHPTPWKAAQGGLGFDVSAELFVPQSFNTGNMDNIGVAKVISTLMRLWASPSITLPVVSNISFSTAAEAKDNEAHFMPLEIKARCFQLEAPESTCLTIEDLQWIKDNFVHAIKLIGNHLELRLAVDAFDSGQFIQNPSLAIVSLWAALEALFSPAKTAELRFRISALIASYLEKPGEQRQKLYKKIKELYNKRSEAVHGHPMKNPDALFQTFMLLRDVLIRLIGDNHVPSQNELERCLFRPAL